MAVIVGDSGVGIDCATEVVAVDGSRVPEFSNTAIPAKATTTNTQDTEPDL